MVAPLPSGRSAQVRLELHVGTECFQIAQIGGGRLIFDNGVVLPGTRGEVIARIDDTEHRWKVEWEENQAPRRIIEAEFRAVR